MRLSDLLHTSYTHPIASGHSYHLHGANPETITLEGLTDDSRAATSSVAFVAVRGTHHDGHSYIASAIESGCRAIVIESLPEVLTPEVCYIEVEHSAEALGLLAAGWWGHPSDDLKVVGITGTNGKTTTATLLYRLYTQAGYPTGLLSTVCNYVLDRAVPSTHTTPGAPQLQALLAQMRDAGCSYVFMEVSSHAVDQRRIAGLKFSGGVFTNLTRDHLDYHGSVREYLYAKKRFMDDLPREAFALSNADDRNATVMLQNTRAKKLYYALHAPADYEASILEQYPDGTLITIAGREVLVRLVGAFNIYNLLAVYAVCRELGMPDQETLRHLSLLSSVDGRLETIHAPEGYTAFVDYAHTPDALVNVLETLRELRGAPRGAGERQIICVVGCGGDRDRGKRPIMAAEAARLADRVILTSDNPRSEDPVEIIAEMRAGLTPEDLTRVLSIVDRTEAIRTACMLARRGDLILVAGKGHETYQEIQGVRHPFDDREVLRSILSPSS